MDYIIFLIPLVVFICCCICFKTTNDLKKTTNQLRESYIDELQKLKEYNKKINSLVDEHDLSGKEINECLNCSLDIYNQIKSIHQTILAERHAIKNKQAIEKRKPGRPKKTER